MLCLKSILRMLLVTLLALALLAPAIPAPTTGSASGRQPPRPDAYDLDDDDDSDDDGDSEDDVGGRRGPCDRIQRRDRRDDDGPRRQCASGSSSGIAKGDFNGDGFGDLAIGVPREDVDGQVDAGAVNVIYGSATVGLVASGANVPTNQFFTQEGIGAFGDPEAGDQFGSALAAGDFNGDDISDLAIAAPQEELRGTIFSAGRVSVLFGSAGGLTLLGSQDFTQDSDSISDDPENGDLFGSSLAWGDFNGDGAGDLAIGVLFEEVNGQQNAGAVHVLYGLDGVGLTAAGSQFWTQESPIHGDGAEASDFFGAALAAGDFNGDTRSDLAIGVREEDVGNIVDAGAVHVLYGAAGGLTGSFSAFFTQDSTDINDQAERGDEFGSALAAGDFNGDTRSDLAIGVPEEAVGSIGHAGAVSVIYGSADGLSADGDQFWHQNSSGVPDTAEGSDAFGSALAAGDFNGDGRRDLAIGVPDEDVGSAFDGGAVNVIYGSVLGLHAFIPTLPGGFQPPGSSVAQFFDQGQSGLPDSAEGYDFFGSALTAWDFGVGSFTDLAIGVPREGVGSIDRAGAVHVLYGGPPRCCVVGGGGLFGGLRGPGQFWTQDSEDILDQVEDGDLFGHALY